MPLFHVTGEVPLFLQSFAIARKLVFMPRWDAREAMRLHTGWKRAWTSPTPKKKYQVIIVGAGGHGLAAENRGVRRHAGWIESGIS